MDATELLLMDHVTSDGATDGVDAHTHRMISETPLVAPDRRAHQQVAPPDRCWLATIIFFVQGIGSIYPWNSVITAERYFTDYKFANVSDNVEYKDKFMLYVGYANFTPYIFFLYLSLYFPFRTSQRRCLCSLVAMLFLFIVTTVLAFIDSSSWADLFFGITMVTVVLFNVASAVYQSCMHALAAKLPGGRFTQSYIVGQGFGGTFVAISLLISIASAGTLWDSARGYFITAVVVLFICLLSYCLLVEQPMVSFYLDPAKEKDAVDAVDQAASFDVDSRLQRFWATTRILWAVFNDIKMQVFNIWMTFFVSLSLFPVVMAEIQSTQESDFNDTYFVPLVCFFTFNLGDFLGSLIPAVPQLRWQFPKWTWIIVVSRLVFAPLFIFCNYRPNRRTLPVLIDDYAYSFFMVVFSLSSGYLKAIVMMDGPETVSKPEWASKAASMMIAFLVLGIFCGIQFSRFFPWVVDV